MPKVSVIIPIYGVEKYIERCARSLFEQTLDDIEYIFVNDCTMDNSIKVLESIIHEYPERYKQVKIIHHETNKGLPIARLTGIKSACGDYIAHCDSDDWVYKSMYEDLYTYATHNDKEIVFCDYEIYENESSNIKQFKKNITDLTRNTVIRRLLISSDLNPIWSLLAKKSLYDDIVAPVGAQSEDKTYTIQLCLKSQKIGYLPRFYYAYRITSNSISHSFSKNKLKERFQQSKDNADLISKFLLIEGSKEYFKEELVVLYLNLNKFLYKNISDSDFKLLFESQPIKLKQLLCNKYVRLLDIIIYIYLVAFSKFF